MLFQSGWDSIQQKWFLLYKDSATGERLAVNVSDEPSNNARTPDACGGQNADNEKCVAAGAGEDNR